MKYKDKYPDMTPIYDERDGIIKSLPESSIRHCHQCIDETPFINIYYEAPFCSEECLFKWETEFFEKYK